jgi:SHS2 domain-containing protein
LSVAPGRYELVDHTGDLAIRVLAPSFDALLATAALALFELLLDDRAAVLPRTTIEIPIDRARSQEERVKGLLSELLFRFDVERFVVADVTIDAEHARCVGETFDPARHAKTRSIKAVTYHGLLVKTASDGSFSAQIVFDI